MSCANSGHITKLKQSIFSLGYLWEDVIGCAGYKVLAGAGNTNWGGKLSTIDLLIKVDCFVKKENIIFNIKQADLNWLVQGSWLYWTFPFSKTSLAD